MVFKAAPLGTGFLFTGIIGFFVSVLYLWAINATWAFTFAVFFIIMIIASLISMVKAQPGPQLGIKKRIK